MVSGYLNQYPVKLHTPGSMITHDQTNAVEAYFRAFPEKKVPFYGIPEETLNEAIEWFNHRGYE